MDLPNTRLWRDDPRPMASSPLIVVPTASSDAVMLEAVKVWPGKGGVRRKVGATANLDSSCARRLCNTAGRGEETGLQVEQRNRSRKKDAPLRNRLTKKAPYKAPYKGGLHRSARLDAGKKIKGKK